MNFKSLKEKWNEDIHWHKQKQMYIKKQISSQLFKGSVKVLMLHNWLHLLLETLYGELGVGVWRYRFDPWVRKIPWTRKWQPTPVFLPGEFHGQRSPADPWGHTEKGITEHYPHMENRGIINFPDKWISDIFGSN